MTPYELGLHVNLIVRAPGGGRDLMTDALSSEVDLLPIPTEHAACTVVFFVQIKEKPEPSSRKLRNAAPNSNRLLV
jgi:hypothetical protein